jgi:flagellar basal-body rod protein FlgB
MLDKMTGGLNFHSNALVLRAERQRMLSSNIANADTPAMWRATSTLARPCVAATSSPP